MHDLANCHPSDVLNDSLKEKDDVICSPGATNDAIPQQQMDHNNMEPNYSMASSGQNTTTSEIKDMSDLITSCDNGESSQNSAYKGKR